MAKLSIEEFNKKYSDRITDNDDLVIELMEDFSDSISVEESKELDSLRAEKNRLEIELGDIKRKYKERFLTAVREEKEEKVPELEEKEEKVIDIKEI